jgi:cyclopropane fatty-acyl-phospholipid synthase-like methyltransferase
MIKQFDYDLFAEYYPELEENPKEDNKKNVFLNSIFKKYKVKTVFDVSCGTGLQTIYLTKKGYTVKASDLSKEMLKIARKRAKKENLKISFRQANMIDVKLGKADAVISIFNAIGHLSEKQFELMIKNVSNNLNNNGLFIFDIFNLDSFKNNFINYEFIDCAKTINDIKFVRYNNNQLDLKEEKMQVNQKTYFQKGFDKPKLAIEKWDMKLYNFQTLNKLLNKNGFEVIEKYGSPEKTKFTINSNSIFIVAKKM